MDGTTCLLSVEPVETAVGVQPMCVAVLNMIRFPDPDPTGFCNLEPDRNGFRNNLCRVRYGYPYCVDHCGKVFNQRFFGYKPDWILYLDCATGL